MPGPEHTRPPTLLDQIRAVFQSPSVIRFRCRKCNYGIECEYDERNAIMTCPSCATNQYVAARFFAWNDRLRVAIARRSQSSPEAVVGEAPAEDWRHSAPLSLLDRIRRWIQSPQTVWSRCRACGWLNRTVYTDTSQPRQCTACGRWQYLIAGSFAWNARIHRHECTIRQLESQATRLAQEKSETEQLKAIADRERIRTEQRIAREHAACEMERVAAEKAKVAADRSAAELLIAERKAAAAKIDPPIAPNATPPKSHHATSINYAEKYKVSANATSWLLAIICAALVFVSLYQYKRAEKAVNNRKHTNLFPYSSSSWPGAVGQSHSESQMHAKAAMDRLARMPPGTWHSRTSRVYHNNPLCDVGNNIEIFNRVLGTGDKMLCKRCEEIGKND